MIAGQKRQLGKGMSSLLAGWDGMGFSGGCSSVLSMGMKVGGFKLEQASRNQVR